MLMYVEISSYTFPGFSKKTDISHNFFIIILLNADVQAALL